MSDKRIHLNLKRGSKGLGFNIVGGTDLPNKSGDFGIFVSKIKKDGAAFEDGTLQVGDRIIEINSIKLEAVTHSFAVEKFLGAGDDVRLVIERRESPPQPSRQFGNFIKIGLPLLGVVVGVAVVVAVVVRNRK